MSSSEEYDIKRFLERPNELKNVPVHLIDVIFPNNKRRDYGNIDWLADSIMVNGLKNPLVLYAEACDPGYEKALFYEGSSSYAKGYYRLVVQDGHRRFKAIQQILQTNEGKEKLKTVPCRGTKKAESTEERLLNQILMNSGKNFEPIEVQAVFRELTNFGWTPAKIAEKAGCTVVHVNKMLELSTVEELTKYMIERGEISATLVLDTLPDVRQLAQLENKSENQVYQEIAEKSKRSNGTVKTKDFKQNLAIRQSEKLSKSDPAYYSTLTNTEIIKRLSVCIGIKKVDDNLAVVSMPLGLWETIQERIK